jgi:hypothetical protein
MIGELLSRKPTGIWSEVLCAVVALVWSGIARLYGTKTTKSLRRPEKEKQKKKAEQVGAWYVFLLHPITSLL